MIPSKLKKGNGVRIITPAWSLSLPWLNEDLKQRAVQRLKSLGLEVSFGKHVSEKDEFDSSTVQSRIEDLHDAFEDESVKLILTVIGGFNSNQLLDYIDYRLVKSNPKILCGYSDITALQNAIYARIGLATYSGPHFFNFGEKKGFDYTLEYFKKCLFSDEPFEVIPSESWSDDLWANDQENRNFHKNEGCWTVNEGRAEGKIVGANLCTFQLLQGTKYCPSLKDTILFLEEDDWARSETADFFDRNLQSLIHQPGFEEVGGIVIGRFRNTSEMTREKIRKIVKTKEELENIPVIAGADFGHTLPMITFPIGGKSRMIAENGKIKLEILEH